MEIGCCERMLMWLTCRHATGEVRRTRIRTFISIPRAMECKLHKIFYLFLQLSGEEVASLSRSDICLWQSQ